jgi:cytochrome c biogenesis protein CcmG/thiol:disulfide interchange protein DsbE
MRRLLLPALASVLALAFVGLLIKGVLATHDDRSIDDALAQGRHPRAHDAALPLLDGGTRTLADYRGKVVLLNFFAHWCKPCMQEAPLLASTQKAIASRGGTVVGVAWDDTTDKARAFAHQFGLDYPILRDVDGSFARAYGVLAMPETFLIDRRGRIAALARGEIDPHWIGEHVDPLLAPAPS